MAKLLYYLLCRTIESKYWYFVCMYVCHIFVHTIHTFPRKCLTELKQQFISTFVMESCCKRYSNRSIDMTNNEHFPFNVEGLLCSFFPTPFFRNMKYGMVVRPCVREKERERKREIVDVISVTMRKMYGLYPSMKEKVGKPVYRHKKVAPDEVEVKQKHTPNVNVYIA